MIPNEDHLRRMYDEATTHNDPHSPYYDGPDEDADLCPICECVDIPDSLWCCDACWDEIEATQAVTQGEQ